MEYFQATVILVLSVFGFKYLDGIIRLIKSGEGGVLYVYAVLVGVASLFGFWMALDILRE